MALVPDVLFGTAVNNGPTKRAVPHQDGTAPARFASAVGGPTLAILTPVAFDTSVNLWKVWANAGTNGVNVISGFVYPEAIVLSASGEVIGTILKRGLVHRDDVVLPAGETQNNLDVALAAATLREKGIVMQGVVNVQ